MFKIINLLNWEHGYGCCFGDFFHNGNGGNQRYLNSANKNGNGWSCDPCELIEIYKCI